MENNLMTGAARELRARQTEVERILWFKLRDKQFNDIKFRRQEPIGNYIVDFVSFEKKLILEINGNSHRESSTKINDNQRTRWLQEEGFRVLRFWNSDILNNIEVVVEKIKESVNEQGENLTPFRISSPQRGRGKGEG